MPDTVKKLVLDVNIIEYDKDAFLNLLIGKGVASFALSKYLNKERIEINAGSKVLFVDVCKKASDEVNKQIKKAMPGLLSQDINITKILYVKKNQGMTLQVDAENVDIDNMLDAVINLAKDSTKKAVTQDGKEGLSENQKLIFNLLKSINKDVAADEKVKLVQLVLGWINSNGLVQKTLNTLIAENADIRAKLEPLKLNVGDVKILTD